MPNIPRGGDDLLLDGMVTKLTAFRAREVAISSAVDFDLGRDRTQPWKDLLKPLVNLEADTDEPDDKANGFATSVKAYCFVPSLTDDAVAASRLYYLKEQVRVGLLALISPDLGQTLGTVKIKKPRWARVVVQDRETEVNVLAGVWTFEVTYSWEPEDISASELTDVRVDVGPSVAAALWAAAYHYGEEE
jgi:hypothetical protein